MDIRYKRAAIAAACGFGLAAATTAQASSNRVWVSGHGVDQSGCGAPTAPCRSLQYAHDHAVIAGGEIDILDPAGYGAVTISKALSIVNDGVGTAGVQATSGDAITINAGPTDAVYLRGLNIDGVQGSASEGVQLNLAGSLTILNCVARHFSQDGVKLAPASGTVRILIADSVLGDNSQNGVLYAPLGSATVTAMIDRVIANGNGAAGIDINGAGATGTAHVSIANSVGSNNGANGLAIDSATGLNTIVDVDNATFNLNGSDGLGSGIVIKDHGALVLSRSVLISNVEWGINNSFSTSTVILTTGDNRIFGNPSGDVVGQQPTSGPLQ